MQKRSLSAVFAFAILAMFVMAVSASGASGSDATGLYIVQMQADPAVAYEGGVAGIPATKPANGKKFDSRAAGVEQYVGHLKATHDSALASVGAEKVYDYVYTYNGAAARMTADQAAALAKRADVVAVVPEMTYTVDTSSTPTFLGLDAENGIWDRLNGPKGYGSKGGAGENIIIGVVDSGIWPQSTSFSDRQILGTKAGKVVYGPVAVGPPPAGWAGTCQTGEQFAATDCNNKLIGARYFNASQGGNAGIDANRPWEFNSPRDYHGHGTHTTSTAGGNFGVPATGAAAIFGKTSGIAPRARVATYKALWSTQDGSTASGGTTDLAAAIDRAVADGVDVINYSVSGATTNFQDPVQIAFLNAARVGVFVSASAGNSGPTAGTVAHPSPWLTTVAAEQHDRQGKGSATINGVVYNGASAGTGSASGSMVTFGARASNPRLCMLNSLTPAAAGKIVVCERGVNARLEKSFEVQRVGGIGMILVNPSANSLNADLHFVPSVHLDHTTYDAIEAAALAGQTASIAGQVLYGQPAPFIAAFSSRGPTTAAGGDILKPDLGAPGQDILASVAPPANRGRDFDLYSGTSMSAPHVAGLAALFKQLHPGWSPMAIKSALMTTGTDILDAFTDTAASDPSAQKAFAQGAGHVQPNAAMDPGLVYDSGLFDWVAFMCGSSPGFWTPGSCTTVQSAGFSTAARDMNTASVQLANMAGTQTVKRRVTNVSSSTSTYTAAASMNGVSVSVSPSTLTLAPGETKSFEITFLLNGAPLNKFTAGHLTWSDGTHNVRIPLVVRPRQFASPAEVTSNGSPVSWKVNIGYNGPLSASVGGLVAATQTAWTVTQDPDQTFVRTDPTGTFEYVTTVPNGSVFRAGIYEDAIAPTGTDLDMFAYRCTATTCTAVATSADGDSNEEITVTNTTGAAAEYRVYVHGWSTNGPSASGTLFTWQVGTTSAGNTTLTGVVSPASVGQQEHTATFSGLAANTRYLGRVDYSSGTTALGRTLLNVRTP